MAKAQYTERLIVRVTPEMKNKVETEMPNPSQFVRNAINDKIKTKNRIQK